MSKNIVIQEGGVPRQLTADKQETALVGGGSCLWIPEDEAKLGKKSITQNGTYTASAEGLYGYSEVTVSGVGKATGTGPDGEEHTYEETEGGGVTDTVLPSSIEVTTPPSFTGPYGDGAYIGFDGLVVTAYTATGAAWTGGGQYPNGIIPIADLVFPVTVTDYSATTHRDGSISATSDLNTLPVTQPIRCGTEIPSKSPWSRPEDPPGFYAIRPTAGTSETLPGKVTATTYGMDTLHQHILGATEVQNAWLALDNGGGQGIGLSYTYDGKTVYYAQTTGAYLAPDGYSAIDLGQEINNNNAGPIAWTLIYGDITEIGGGDFQSVPVQFIRPGDEKTLEASFEVSVVDLHAQDED